MKEQFAVLYLKRRMAWNRKKGKEDNLLFLDFDGVINTFDDDAKKNYQMPSHRCMKNLNQLCHDRHLKIVISSSWRYDGIENCEKYLREGGLDPDIEIVGTTPKMDFKGRPAEILQYVTKEKDLTGFLIVDDLPMDYLSAFAYRTDFEKGLDQEALQTLEKIRWE
ncbi:MAG: HAD domain-containing protein [Galactobacillus timonensis]|uniref:HAD domain-containing protein n=1 Tax=Galactobacillus timonensis TaxID=2041840 RepID=UPI00240940E4|nr:HAD domain-containing protein [Galactobacillus timonensis]MDD5851188.1 HAD domain-containing protein [Galactobacillus timonensis]MDD6600784.1 HAD domain-containing protein [Galactobacillus timonensis]